MLDHPALPFLDVSSPSRQEASCALLLFSPAQALHSQSFFHHSHNKTILLNMFTKSTIIAFAAALGAVNASPLLRRQETGVTSLISSAVSSAVSSATGAVSGASSAASSAVSSATGAASSAASTATGAASSAVGSATSSESLFSASPFPLILPHLSWGCVVIPESGGTVAKRTFPIWSPSGSSRGRYEGPLVANICTDLQSARCAQHDPAQFFTP